MINCLIGGLLNMPLDEMGYDGIDTSYAAGVVKSTRFGIIYVQTSLSTSIHLFLSWVQCKLLIRSHVYVTAATFRREVVSVFAGISWSEVMNAVRIPGLSRGILSIDPLQRFLSVLADTLPCDARHFFSISLSFEGTLSCLDGLLERSDEK